jgi:hypothetical protein
VQQHFIGLIRHAAGCEDHPTHVRPSLSPVVSVQLDTPSKTTNVRMNVDLSSQFPIPAAKPGSKSLVAVAFAADCLENITACLEDESVDPSDIPSGGLSIRLTRLQPKGP